MSVTKNGGSATFQIVGVVALISTIVLFAVYFAS